MQTDALFLYYTLGTRNGRIVRGNSVLEGKIEARKTRLKPTMKLLDGTHPCNDFFHVTAR